MWRKPVSLPVSTMLDWRRSRAGAARRRPPSGAKVVVRQARWVHWDALLLPIRSPWPLLESQEQCLGSCGC